MKHLSTFDDLIVEAESLDLYTKLIQQLNKDLLFANVSLEFDIATLPLSLKLILQEKVLFLLESKFTEYLNLLYIVDVSESKIKQLDGSNLEELSEQVTFLILKREWQKVWFKNKL